MIDKKRDNNTDESKKPFPIRKWLFEPVSDRGIFYIGLAAGIMLAAAWMIYRTFIGDLPSGECAFKHVTGLYCPGCGGTRAMNALLSGHFVRAFVYHPFVPYCIIMWILYVGSHLLEILHVPHIKGMKFRTAYMWTGLGIIVLNWIVKNVLLIVLNLR